MAEREMWKADMDRLRTEVNQRLDGVQDAIKELAKAMLDLVRVEGNVQRVEEKTDRIGNEVDELEKRTRKLEHDVAGNSKSVGLVDWLLRNALTVLLSAGLGALLIKTTGA